MKRCHILLYGRVQGVGFRHFASYHARKLQLTGSVANLYDGSVEVYVQGEDGDVNVFIETLIKGDGWIRVDRFHSEQVEVLNDETGFRVLGY